MPRTSLKLKDLASKDIGKSLKYNYKNYSQFLHILTMNAYPLIYTIVANLIKERITRNYKQIISLISSSNYLLLQLIYL